MAARYARTFNFFTGRPSGKGSKRAPGISGPSHTITTVSRPGPAKPSSQTQPKPSSKAKSGKSTKPTKGKAPAKTSGKSTGKR